MMGLLEIELAVRAQTKSADAKAKPIIYPQSLRQEPLAKEKVRVEEAKENPRGLR